MGGLEVIGLRGRILVKEGMAGRSRPTRAGRAGRAWPRIRLYGTPGEFRYLIYGIVEGAGPEERPSSGWKGRR